MMKTDGVLPQRYRKFRLRLGYFRLRSNRLRDVLAGEIDLIRTAWIVRNTGRFLIGTVRIVRWRNDFWKWSCIVWKMCHNRYLMLPAAVLVSFMQSPCQFNSGYFCSRIIRMAAQVHHCKAPIFEANFITRPDMQNRSRCISRLFQMERSMQNIVQHLSFGTVDAVAR